MTVRALHVAILDDDPSVRTALVRLLKTAGMTVDAYETSDQLFESVALECPDCLLLDLEMPVMSGLDVLKHLDERQKHIPTIIITGSDVADSRSSCLNAGAIACLDKPLDAVQLIRTIGQILVPPQPGTVPSFT